VVLSCLLAFWLAGRVFLGVHFPLDIIGAGLLALPTAWLLMQFLQYRQYGMRLIAVLERMYARIFRLPLIR
jgi:membrane-associated phospholipid phosphatase